MVEHGDLVTSIFGDRIDPETVATLAERVILTSKNDDALVMNERVLDLLHGEAKTYHSADSIVSDDPNEHHRFPVEFLHRQSPSGMAPHALKLKIGSFVMLLRNLNRSLCNGTRCVVKAMHDRFLELEVLTGTNKGERIILPRIDLAPTDSHLPFILKRLQFPVRLEFVMTINKSQGQTFQIVGLFLPEPVFSHGQLYVALSRGQSPEFLKVKVVDRRNQGKLIPDSDSVFTKNIVFKEILQDEAYALPTIPPIDHDEWDDMDSFNFGFDDPTFGIQHNASESLLSEIVDSQATTISYKEDNYGVDSQATTISYVADDPVFGRLSTDEEMDCYDEFNF